jgi:hypothetical protein
LPYKYLSVDGARRDCYRELKGSKLLHRSSEEDFR